MRISGARIDVSDTGVGMTPDVVPHVFERFYRGDPSRSSATEGVGLGLSLAKWIVERHGGRITVASRAEQRHDGHSPLPTSNINET